MVEGLEPSEIKDAEKIQSADALSSGQTVEEKLKEIQDKIQEGITDDEGELTETEQLEELQDIESVEGQAVDEPDDKTQQLIDKAE